MVSILYLLSNILLPFYVILLDDLDLKLPIFSYIFFLVAYSTIGVSMNILHEVFMKYIGSLLFKYVVT